MTQRIRQLNLLQILWSKKIQILGIATVIAIATYVYSLFMPYTYKAVGTILPPRTSSTSPLSQLLSTEGSTPLKLIDIETPQNARLALDLLKSQRATRIILQQTGLIDHPDFRDLSIIDQWGKLLSHYDFWINSNGVITIQAQYKTPAFPTSAEKDSARIMAAKLVNAAITALDSIQKEQYTTAARQMREYLASALIKAKHRLDSLYTEMVLFREKYHILDIEQQLSAVTQAATDLAVQIAQTQTQLDLARIEYAVDHPLVQQLEAKLSALRNRYYALQEGGLVTNDLLSIPLAKVPEISKRYAELLQELKIQEQLTLFLEQQRAQEALKEQKNVPTIQVLDYAVPPTARSSPQRGLMVLLAFTVTFLLYATLVIIIEIRKSQSHFFPE